MENSALVKIVPSRETGQIEIEVPGYTGAIVVEIYTRQNTLVYELTTTMEREKLQFKPEHLVSSIYRFKITTDLLHWEQLIEL